MEVDTTNENVEIAPALTPDKISMDFHRGTIVWARCGPTFPFWPSCIIPNELLPMEIRQPLFSSPFDDAGEGFTSEALKRKISVYYYGRNDFDLIRPKEIKPFLANYELYREQPMTSDMVTMFEMAILQAQEDLALNVDDRLLKLNSMNFTQLNNFSDTSNKTNTNPELNKIHDLQNSSIDPLETQYSTLVLKSQTPVNSTVDAGSVFDQPVNSVVEASSVFDQPVNSIVDAGSVFDQPVNSIVEAGSVFEQPVNSIVEAGSVFDQPVNSIVDAGSLFDQPVNSIVEAGSVFDQPVNSVVEASSVFDQPVNSIVDAGSVFDQPVNSTVDAGSVFDLPAKEVVQAGSRFDLPTREVFEAGSVFDQPVNSIVDAGSVFDRPVNSIVEAGSVFDQPVNEVVEASSVFDQPVNEVVEASSVFDQPVNEVVEASSVFDKPVNEVVEMSSVFDQPVNSTVEAGSVFEQPVDLIVEASSVFDQPVNSTVDAGSVFDQPVNEVAEASSVFDKPVNEVVEMSSVFDQPVNLTVDAGSMFDQPVNSTVEAGSVFDQPANEISKGALVNSGLLCDERCIHTEVKEVVDNKKPEDNVNCEMSIFADSSKESSIKSMDSTAGPKKIKSVKVMNIANSSLFGSSNSGGVDLFGSSDIVSSEKSKSMPQAGLPVPVSIRPKVSVKSTSSSTNKIEVLPSKPFVDSSNNDLFSTATGANNSIEHNSTSSTSLFSSAPASVFDQQLDSAVAGINHPQKQSSTANKTAADVFATTPVPPVIPMIPGQKKASVSAADFFTSAAPPQPALPSVGPSGPPLPFAVPPSAPGVRPLAPASTPLVRNSSSSVIDSPVLQRESSSSQINSLTEKTQSKNSSGVRHGSSHMLQAANRLNQSMAQNKVNVPEVNGASSVTPSLDSSSAVNTAVSVPLAGRKIHKPVSAICSFGFGGVCILSFPPSNSVPPIMQSVGNRFDSPLHRLPLLGATPNSLLVRRQHTLWNKIANKYGKNQNEMGEEETKCLLETLRIWKAGDLEPTQTAQQSEALKTAVQFVQKMIVSPLRGIATVRTSSISRQDTCTDALSEDSICQNEKFLWRVLEILLYSQNCGPNGLNNSSLEEKLLALLTEKDDSAVDASQTVLPHGVPPFSTTSTLNGAALNQADYQQSVEQLIALGQREKAVDLALGQQDFALALLIAALCDPSVYQKVVQSMMESRFTKPAYGVMQTFGMICCNQVQGAPILQPPSAKPTAFQIADKHLVSSSSASTTTKELAQNWRLNAALLLSTKTQDWQSLLLRLAERLQSEMRDSVLTQGLLLITDALPHPLDFATSQTITGSDLQVFLKEQSLLHRSGCGVSQMADVQSVTALRASEIFESVLFFKLNGIANQDNSNCGSSSGKGNSGLFGWFGASSNVSESSNTKDKKKLFEQQKHRKQQAEERLASYKAFLLPLQLRFAMFLADSGLIAEAKSYTDYIQKNIKYLHEFHQSLLATMPPPTTEQANSGHVIHSTKIKLSKKFIQAFEEFEERLTGHSNVVGSGNNKESNNILVSNGQEQSTKPSNWGTPFSFNVSLKDLVDGPQPVTPSAPAVVPSMSHQMPPPPAMTVPNPQSGSFSSETNKQAIHEFQGAGPAVQNAPFPSYQPYNNSPNPISPPPAHHQPSAPSHPIPGISSGIPTGPPLPGGRSPAFYSNPTTNYVNALNSGVVESKTAIDRFDSNVSNVANSNNHITTNSTNSMNGLSAQTSKNDYVNKTHPSHSPAPLAVPNAPQPSQQQTQPAQSPQPPQTQPANTDDLSAPTSGIMGTIRKGIIKWIMPNAVDATENTGSKLEAYFDKQLNRWVFPGEDPQDVAPLPPPPTSMAPATSSINNSSSMSFSNTASSATTSSSIDPLAALMAPPSRSIPSAASFNNLDDNSNDPLSMMMRPPPIRGIPSVGNMSNMSPMASSNASHTSAPPKISVWKPPTAPAANAAFSSDVSPTTFSVEEPTNKAFEVQTTGYDTAQNIAAMNSAPESTPIPTNEYFSSPVSSTNYNMHQFPPNDFGNNF